MKRRSFATTFCVSPSRTRRNGLSPINLTISYNGSRATMSTGRQVKFEDWDNKRQRVRGSSDEANAINDHLQLLRTRLYDKENELLERGYIVNANILRDAMLDRIDTLQAKSLMQLFREYLADRKSDMECGKIAKDTYTNIERAYELVLMYLKHRYKRSDMALLELNHSFIASFHTFLLNNRKMKQNTSVKSLRILKQVINVALADRHLPTDPFVKFKIQREVVERDFLTNDELESIINHSFSTSRLERARDVFVFACYTGLSYSDLKTLAKEHISEDDSGRLWIKKHRVKTGVLFRVPLLPIPKLILEKYRESEEMLPVGDLSTFDEYLKEIAALCGINKRVSTHTARYTFATTVTLTNRVSIDVVAKMMGHTNTRMTSHYAKVVDDYIAAEMDRLQEVYGE
ncbi:MAG: site-specific integrase [Alistipes sp.]|nr:site-specific integrase [Alistipes sp.]MBQ8204409.1 site-specific integrase [Alistipes sp.]